MPMTTRLRPTYAELKAAGAREERDACVEYIRDTIAEVSRLQARGAIGLEEAKLLNRRLDAVADGISAGLHR